jgi:hypothetical protein
VRRQITAARSERNALAPLTSLLPELVRTVFELLQVPEPEVEAMLQYDEYSSYADEDDDGEQHGASLTDDDMLCALPDGWLAFANTCSWTRGAALAFPALWASIDCSSGERALRSVERAGNIPLGLYLSPRAGTQGMQFLADHVLRARELAYCEHEGATDADKEVHVRRFVDALNGACPLLEELGLVDYHERPFLTGVYDNLHTLLIDMGEYCFSKGSMAHLPRLRNLSLRAVGIDDGVFELVRMLNRHPTIECLSLVDLDDCVQQPVFIGNLDADVDVKDADFKIALPVLRKLVLKTDLRSSAVFIRIIPLPSECLDVSVARADMLMSDPLDTLYQKEIVERARTLWKAVTGHTAFDDGTFRAEEALGLYRIRWTGTHGSKSLSVGMRILQHESLPYAHDCTVLEWTNAEYEVRELLDATLARRPVMVNLRKVVLWRADDTISRGLKSLKTLLFKRLEAGRKIDVVEFVECKPEKKSEAEELLAELCVQVIWRV